MAEDGPVPARHTHGHPDVETLAALDADALEPSAVAEVRDHVDGCAQCQGTIAELRDVRSRLAALPAPQLPAQVADRIDTALREVAAGGTPAAASSAVTQLNEQRARRTRRNRWAGLAAAALAVIAAGAAGFAISQSSNGGSAGSSVAVSGGQATKKAPAHSRVGAPERRTAGPGAVGAGPDYTAGSLAAAIPSIVRGGGVAGAMSDPDRRAGCARALVGAGHPPLAVTSARFEGRAGYVFVFPTGVAHRADVYVVGPGCSAGDAQRRFRTSAAY
jgi:hypothetical protein